MSPRKVRNMNATRARRRQFLWDYRAAHPCVECGMDAPRCLQFAHRPGTDKQFNICDTRITVSQTRLEAEIAKCDVKCANCHSIDTFEARRQNPKIVERPCPAVLDNRRAPR